MITININEETLKKAFDSHIEALMNDTYNSPVKRVCNDLFGYNGTALPEVKKQISEAVDNLLKTEKFITMVGEAFAREIAKREVDRMEKNTKRVG